MVDAISRYGRKDYSSMKKIIVALLISLLGLSACGLLSDINNIQEELPPAEDAVLEDEVIYLDYKTVRWLQRSAHPFIVAPRGRGRDGNEETLANILEIEIGDRRESIIERFGEPNLVTGSGMATYHYYTSDGFTVLLWPNGNAGSMSIVDCRQRIFGLIDEGQRGAIETGAQNIASRKELGEDPAALFEIFGYSLFNDPHEYDGEYWRLPLPISSFIEDYIYIDRDLTLADALDAVSAGGFFDAVVDEIGEPNGWQNHSGHIVYYYEMSDGFWVLFYVGWNETGVFADGRIVYNLEIIDLTGRRFSMFWRFDPSNPPPEWEPWWTR